jgi:hypothetical protein
VAANGGSGPQTTLYDSANVGIDIVSYGLKGFGARPNVGISTSATISGAFCMDTGLDPVEADTMGAEVVDDVGDCQDSNVAWTSVDKPGNASFDGLPGQQRRLDFGGQTRQRQFRQYGSADHDRRQWRDHRYHRVLCA